MNHGKKNRKFGREQKGRNALMKSLAFALIIEGKIQTTEAKAKSLRPYVEKMITLGRTNSLATRRLLVSRVGSIGAKKMITDVSPKYIDRRGGYTRITKLPRRLSDGASQAIIELL